MKRFFAVVVLMVASSSVQAGTISFSVGGHRVRIDAPRGCSSSSCASIAIPGIYESRRKRDEDTRTRNTVSSPQPTPAPIPGPVTPAPATAPVQQSAPPAAAPAPTSAPAVVYTPAAVTIQEVALPPLPPVPQAPKVEPETVARPCATPPETPNVPRVPPPLQVSHQDDPVDSPIGDWQTEGKSMVRIAECGRALCGYAIKEGESEKGETILINMKAKSDSQWIGSVYSKESGGTYYGSMRLRGPSTLRVEACAFGNFYCNGNNWTRVASKSMVTSRQITEPRT